MQANDELESRIVDQLEINNEIQEYDFGKIITPNKNNFYIDIIPPPKQDYDLKNEKLLGAIIENSTISRSGMKGLSKAKIVYETFAEGGITRFLAIFDSRTDNIEIGPIRSVRDYFLDWAEEYNLPLIHCGGSDTAIERLKKTSRVKNIDEFNEYNKENYFIRNKNIARPHNLFSNTEHFFNINNENINSKSIFFSANSIELENKNTGLKIDFLSAPYNVEYKYDKDKKTYLRFNGGLKHIDTANNQQISVDNIILQKVNYEVIDDKLRLKIYTKTEGDCVFITHGTHEECKWKYENNETSFNLLNDEKIKFNYGNLWIEVIGVNSSYKIIDDIKN